ncbi:YqeB family protein [Micromonospora sp. CPCC 205561]|uniref:YqeB family protein n=1 Tax=Micromonospora sp. CPCC 205561 TaxID=3122407 RepID=UPI002FF279EE
MDGYGTPTVVDGGAAELAVLWGGLPALGAGAGWLLAKGAGWLAGQPWVPAQDLFELVARLPDPQAGLGGVAIGTLGGLVVAAVGTAERLSVSVGTERVRLRRDRAERHVERRSVHAVFVDGKHLVLLGADDEEVARERSDLSADRLRAAFRAHGWPWAEGDPHRDAYRRWVPDLPGLPTGADALLRARQRALDADRGGEARELRGELARSGVVIRDDGKRQYWRLTRTAPRPRPRDATSPEPGVDGR